MSYTHTNRGPVYMTKDLVDPDSTDWVFFIYSDWLRANETIDSHSATVTNGTLETDSSYIGTMTDADGTEYTEAYGVQFTPDSGTSEVTITHRITTSTTDSPSLARENIDHSVVVMIGEQ